MVERPSGIPTIWVLGVFKLLCERERGDLVNKEFEVGRGKSKIPSACARSVVFDLKYLEAKIFGEHAGKKKVVGFDIGNGARGSGNPKGGAGP